MGTTALEGLVVLVKSGSVDQEGQPLAENPFVALVLANGVFNNVTRRFCWSTDGAPAQACSNGA